MLRSWTRRLKIESDLKIGIALSRTRMSVVEMESQGAQQVVRRTKYYELATPLFHKETGDDLNGSLYEIVSTIADGIKDKSCPFNVVIPDIAMHSSTFELDVLPRSNRTLSSLACWRMAKETGRPEDELECQFNVLGTEQGKQLLYVQAGDRYRLDQIRRAFKRSGIIPWQLNSASFYRYNTLIAKGIAPSSAMLSIDDDSWTLLIWDKNNRIRLTMTRMRRNQPCADEALLIGKELTRVVRAWLVNMPETEFNNLYLHGCRAGIGIIDNYIPPGLFKEIMEFDNIDARITEHMTNESSLMSLAVMAAHTE